jgi:hypothetical protein
MREILNVVIVLARCRGTGKLFAIRFEEKVAGQWQADWAFPVKEDIAKREHFDRGEITGSFNFAPTYPGCPVCRARTCFRCSCGKVGCWNTEEKQVTCPWCHRTVAIEGIVTRLSAGGDA